MNRPEISICIPVFNCESYIGEAINSVLEQTFNDYELIIINNASTDNTLKIINKFTDKRIRVISNSENIGFKGNWNLALSETKGKYIKILPADDYLMKDCLEKQVNILNSYENVVIVGCGRIIVNEHSKTIMKREAKNGLVDSGRAKINVVRSGGNPIGEPGAVLFRRDVIDSGELFSDKFLYLIDIDFWLKVLKYGDLYMLGECLAAFRVSKGSTSVNLIGQQGREFKDYIFWLKQKKIIKIGVIDFLTGIIMAYIKSVLRWVFYKIFL
jgi:glycosyltransferase involved in cell wall biosynthesis